MNRVTFSTCALGAIVGSIVCGWGSFGPWHLLAESGIFALLAISAAVKEARNG